MKKYRDLYEEEKRRHEEALQRYQKDHMDEMEIIKLNKSSLKKHRSQMRKNRSLKKHQSHQGLLMIQARINRSLEKHQGQAMEKMLLQNQGKKLERLRVLKKHQSHLNLLTQARNKRSLLC